MKSWVLIAAFTFAQIANGQSRHFASRVKAFSAEYPAKWSQVGSSSLGASEDRLDIVSFPDDQRAEAVVIKPGGAEIILERREATQELWSGEKFLGRKHIKLHAMSLCSSVTATRVLSSSVDGDAIPSGKTVYEDVTIYGCSRGEDHFSLILRHFQGDAKHQEYEEVAKGILDSVRSSVDQETKR